MFNKDPMKGSTDDNNSFSLLDLIKMFLNFIIKQLQIINSLIETICLICP